MFSVFISLTLVEGEGGGANAVPTVQIGADNMNHNTSSNTVCCSYIGGGEGREGGTG